MAKISPKQQMLNKTASELYRRWIEDIKEMRDGCSPELRDMCEENLNDIWDRAAFLKSTGQLVGIPANQIDLILQRTVDQQVLLAKAEVQPRVNTTH